MPHELRGLERMPTVWFGYVLFITLLHDAGAKRAGAARANHGFASPPDSGHADTKHNNVVSKPIWQ